ncbi:serine hydrolase FSH [Gongronella butleri]|nr:serine hydrolase FSH [Gongronella butleri]
MSKLRVLCLHGLFQNEIIFAQQTKALRESVDSLAEFVYVTGPHPIQPKAYHTVEERAKEQETAVSKERQLFGWWYPLRYKSLQDDGTCVGTMETLSMLKRILLEEGPFDGVLGFSQGACLATCLSNMLEDRSILPGFIEPEFAHPPLKFVISVAGFVPKQQEALKPLFSPTSKKSTKSLHIIGNVDHIVLPEDMDKLAACYKSPTIFRHDGTHFVPSSTPAKRAISQFLEPFSQLDTANL